MSRGIECPWCQEISEVEKISKVNRFSLEERYGYQNRKVIYDKGTDIDIELYSIYPIIELLNKFDRQIAELKKQLEEKEKEIQNYKKSNEAYNQLLEECIKELINA